MTSYYENPHISLSGTLDFLQSASNVEVEGASDISRTAGSLASIDIDDKSDLISQELKQPTTAEIHQAYEAFLEDFESSPSVEGSFAICWQPLSFLTRQGYEEDGEASIASEYQKSYRHRLDKMVNQLRPTFEPDGYVLDRDAATFTHLSVGLILLAEQVEGRQSEQLWE